jgi:alkylation response protein AidB-like acyl-CoA dehydrogenase
VAVKLGNLDAEFRQGVAAVLDEAQTLRNDGPGRQGDYENLATGPQRTLIAEAGLIAPHWPRPWGVNATQLQLLIIDEEFANRPDLVRPSLGIAEWILPTLIGSAPADLQERFIPPTQRGELGWCQLFSEPGAGSDLASLTTRATKVDGGWRINGPQDLDVVRPYRRLRGVAGPHRPRCGQASGASSPTRCTCSRS